MLKNDRILLNDDKNELEIEAVLNELKQSGIVNDFSIDGGSVNCRLNLINMLLYYLSSPVIHIPRIELDSMGFFETDDIEFKILLIINFLKENSIIEGDSSLKSQMDDENITWYYEFFECSNISSPDQFGDDYYFHLPLNDNIKHVFVENIDMILSHGLIINSTYSDDPAVLDLEFAAEACDHDNVSFCIEEIAKRSDYPRDMIIENIWKLMKIGVLRMKNN